MNRARSPSTAAKLNVAAMIVAAGGILLQIASGSEAYPTIPPGPIILLAGAGVVALGPWRVVRQEGAGRLLRNGLQRRESQVHQPLVAADEQLLCVHVKLPKPSTRRTERQTKIGRARLEGQRGQGRPEGRRHELPHLALLIGEDAVTLPDGLLRNEPFYGRCRDSRASRPRLLLRRPLRHRWRS
jgi:hypothetical protein